VAGGAEEERGEGWAGWWVVLGRCCFVGARLQYCRQEMFAKVSDSRIEDYINQFE
jgi:hypothetical protein